MPKGAVLMTNILKKAMIDLMSNTNVSQGMAEVLFGNLRLQVLKLLLLRPAESIHLREIARLIEASAGATRRELELLVAAGLLQRTAVGNQVHYQAETGCAVYSELTLLLRKLAQLRYTTPPSRPLLKIADGRPGSYRVTAERGTARRAFANLRIDRRALRELCRQFQVGKLSMFGSVTRRDFRDSSDVDLLVEFLPNTPVGLGRLVDFKDAMSTLFGGRRIDVATKSVLGNPLRRAAILNDLSVVYAAR
jgi:predicted nucleotidyltransferase